MLLLFVGFCVGIGVGCVIGIWFCADSIPFEDELNSRRTVEYGTVEYGTTHPMSTYTSDISSDGYSKHD